MDIATYRLNQPWGQYSENHQKCITRWEGRDGVTITIFFFMFKPNSDMFRGIFGLTGQNKMKAYIKLTVVMRCQIVARKSVAPSSSNLWWRPAPRYACGQDQEFWRKKSFSTIIITPLPRRRPDFSECVTSMNFQ